MNFSRTRELPSNFVTRLALYDIGDVACATLASAWPAIKPALAKGIREFLGREASNPAVRELFVVHGEEIGRLEIAHLGLVLAGLIDDGYVESCHRLTAEHGRMGVSARTRLFARNMVYRQVIALLARRHPIGSRRFAALADVYARALDFDVAVTMTAQLDQSLARSEGRRVEVEDAIGLFEPAIGSVVEAVAAASATLKTSSAELEGAAGDAKNHMASAARVYGEIAANVEDTAAATEQLAQSIAEIGAQSEDSLRLAQAATEDARRSMASLDDLAGTVREIGSVVELISTIAAQTNLLALNATIEAARAGEAGRGFAVVASEVKALAGQTARATADIANRIAAIQAATSRSVEQIGGVAGVVGRIASAATAIAASVEEQGAATRSISDGVRRMAATAADASADLKVIEAASGRNLSAAGTIVDWTDRLSQRAGELEQGVGEFFSRVRGTG